MNYPTDLLEKPIFPENNFKTYKIELSCDSKTNLIISSARFSGSYAEIKVRQGDMIIFNDNIEFNFIIEDSSDQAIISSEHSSIEGGQIVFQPRSKGIYKYHHSGKPGKFGQILVR